MTKDHDEENRVHPRYYLRRNAACNYFSSDLSFFDEGKGGSHVHCRREVDIHTDGTTQSLGIVAS